ncbi:ciliary rootlet coiled-coil protein 2 isoform X2 [Elephas maximus indicus]|uniref:ciliary rootlet coiled-coil protein 2 isoform X2 n=1 Tax=Elephas maximus indicus TaxID=99487 RepID=UPI002116AF0E|nr:ciliary rootlet coiled-coil protein 2 isoform X2 [Elephas maximus indicus]
MSKQEEVILCLPCLLGRSSLPCSDQGQLNAPSELQRHSPQPGTRPTEAEPMDLMSGPTCCPRHSCNLWPLDQDCPRSPTEGCRCPDRAPERDQWQSEKDLRVWLAESRWQRAGLAGRLRAALEALSEQARVLQRRECQLDRGRALCELLTLKQKQAECFLARLEQERHQLRGTQGQEDWRKPHLDIEDKILLLQMEVEKAQQRLDQMSQQPLGPEPSLEAPAEMLVPGQQAQEQSEARAQALQGLGGVSMGAAKAPAQPQDITLLQEWLVMFTQVNKRLSEELGQSHQQLGACLEQLQQLQGELTVLEGRVQALEAERARLLGENSVLLVALGLAPGQEACTPQVQEVPVPLGKELEEKSHPKLHEAEYWKACWHQVVVALKFKEEELQRVQRQSGAWPPQTPVSAQDSASVSRAEALREMGQQLDRVPTKPTLHPHLAGQGFWCDLESQGTWLLPILGLSSFDPRTLTQLRRGWSVHRRNCREWGVGAGCRLGRRKMTQWPLRSRGGRPQELPELRPAEQPEHPGWVRSETERRAQEQVGAELLQPLPQTSLQEVGSELVQMRSELQKVWDLLKAQNLELEAQQRALEAAQNQVAMSCAEKRRLEQQLRSLEQELMEKEQELVQFRASRNPALRGQEPLKIAATALESQRTGASEKSQKPGAVPRLGREGSGEPVAQGHQGTASRCSTRD